jgi:hypothetical protein
MMWDLESDCAPPRNANDTDIHVDIKSLPSSQPLAVFTDSSFLFVSMRSIGMRKKISGLANSLRSRLSLQDTLSHVEALQRCLDHIPRWTDSRSVQARTLLDLQLRQLVVILHATRVIETETNISAERRFSVMSLLEAATTTIDLHTSLLASSNLALCCTRNDYYRAALLVCHATYYTGKNNGGLRHLPHGHMLITI